MDAGRWYAACTSACHGGHGATAAALLDRGADVDAATRTGVTSLLAALRRGDGDRADAVLRRRPRLDPFRRLDGDTTRHVLAFLDVP